MHYDKTVFVFVKASVHSLDFILSGIFPLAELTEFLPVIIISKGLSF